MDQEGRETDTTGIKLYRLLVDTWQRLMKGPGGVLALSMSFCFSGATTAIRGYTRSTLIPGSVPGAIRHIGSSLYWFLSEFVLLECSRFSRVDSC